MIPPIESFLDYSRDDFTEEELKVLKRTFDSFTDQLSHLEGHLMFHLDKIPIPNQVFIENSLRKGLDALERKNLAMNNTLRTRAYLYYEAFNDKKSKYSYFLCKFLELMRKNVRGMLKPDFFYSNLFIERYHCGGFTHLDIMFLVFLLYDLEFIEMDYNLPNGINPYLFLKEHVEIYGLTNKGTNFYRKYCPLRYFKKFVDYIEKLKDKYLFEGYSNLRVRIVAFNRESFSEIIYFRLDFTSEETRFNEPRYSLNEGERVVLFEEIIDFNEFIHQIVLNGFLYYKSGENEYQFTHSIKFPIFFSEFKEIVKPSSIIERFKCETQINFVYFELLEQNVFKFSYDNIINKEFKDDLENIRNSTETINTYMGYNLNALCQPCIVITYPVEAFNIKKKFNNSDEGEILKVWWSLSNKDYDGYFRNKILVEGNYKEIPPKGIELNVEEIKQDNFHCVVQWNGKSDLVRSDEKMFEMDIENPHYRPKPIRYDRGFKLDGIPEQASNHLFDKFLSTFLRIIDLIESNQTFKDLIRSQKYKEIDFRDFFKTHFVLEENWNVDDEFKGKLDRQNDLRVTSANQPLFRISTEFKIWKRNFDKYEPVQELLDNMGNLDKKGMIFMVNPTKQQKNEKLKDELIYEHQKYISKTFEEIEVEDRLFSIYKASYEYRSQTIEVYHIIFNLRVFFREDD